MEVKGHLSNDKFDDTRRPRDARHGPGGGLSAGKAGARDLQFFTKITVKLL